MSAIVFRLQDPGGRPIPRVLARATSPTVGPWAAQANDCGDIFTDLTPAHYDITFSAPGFVDRLLPADLADPGVITVALERGASGPFSPAPHYWSGNFCGVRVPGLSAVEGGASDPSLVLSWFIDRYTTQERRKIYAAWTAKAYSHVVLSWPDSRSTGQTPEQFRDTCRELIANDFYPCVFLASKDHDPKEVDSILSGLGQILPLLIGVVPMFCIGWEANLWLSPSQLQQLIDAITAQTLTQTGTLNYVHFGERVFSWQEDGQNTAAFWSANVGKLTGILAQKELAQDDAAFLDWIHDCLTRCAGNFFMPTDTGFGHPVDFVMLEISAALQFNGTCSEAEGNRLGRLAINAPAESGPAGTLKVSGSGNGA